jgi:hypothetical protein
VVYRGTELGTDLLPHYQEAIGTYKCWYGFTSTSKKRAIAEKYYADALFIIDVSRTGALNVAPYSEFPIEEELLLPPGTTFRIDKVEYRDRKTCIYICVIPEVRMILLGRTGTGNNADDLVFR